MDLMDLFDSLVGPLYSVDGPGPHISYILLTVAGTMLSLRLLLVAFRHFKKLVS